MHTFVLGQAMKTGALTSTQCHICTDEDTDSPQIAIAQFRSDIPISDDPNANLSLSDSSDDDVYDPIAGAELAAAAKHEQAQKTKPKLKTIEAEFSLMELCRILKV